MNPTPPLFPAHEELVEQVAKNAVHETRSFLLQKYQDFLNNKLNPDDKIIYGRIFFDGVLVSETLKKFRPKFHEHQSCFDAFGKPVDASIAQMKDNKFCFSALMLRKKVIKRELRQQAIALLVHEYSELLGAAEEDAVILQEKTLAEFTSN